MDALPVAANALNPLNPPLHRGQSPEQMRKTAQDFEASFLSQMLKPMFEGLET